MVLLSGRITTENPKVQEYPRLIYPEHPRALDYDRERSNFRSGYPGGGGYAAYAFTVGYTRAMLQAALSSS
jgi:mannonate dehydratase